MITDCVCTGCALLCDDIGIEVAGNQIQKTFNACRKGVARIKGCTEPLGCAVKGEEVPIETAIKAAARLLGEARNPLICGLGNSGLEAQAKALELARKTGAYIDDTSSFCQGPVVETLLKGRISGCTLDEVRHRADVIVFWGADPANSHPRHLSKYSYFPRGEERQRGWEEDRRVVVIDVRESDTAKIGNSELYRIPPGADGELLEALTAALSGKVPKVSFGTGAKELLELAGVLKKARFGVLFPGPGLACSPGTTEPLVTFMEALNKHTAFHLIPMAGQYNMRGFNHLLFEQTGFINRVRFGDNGNSTDHGPHCSVVELLRTDTPDAVLVIGSDPLACLPGKLGEKLQDIPIIVIDPCRTFTSDIATVNIPSAYTGIECGGTAVRMDGEPVELTPVLESHRLPDEEILTRIMEAV
jgi:formylmethanofuran dehydrogenase subunit B